MEVRQDPRSFIDHNIQLLEQAGFNIPERNKKSYYLKACYLLSITQKALKNATEDKHATEEQKEEVKKVVKLFTNMMNTFREKGW